MAGEIFNPEPQDIKPDNYIGWSRPITEPKANVSSEIALKGAGQAVKGGVELGVGLEENTIRNDIYNKVDTLNDNYIQRLSQADSLIGGQQGDIDQPPKGGTPGLKKLPDALGTLTAARDNGKMSETYYYQQIYNMAKQMRSQNPMFRDYIDNQFSRITKEQPANDMIKSLTQDINSYAANAREARNKTGTLLDSALKEGMLGANGAGLVMGYRNGTISEQTALSAVAKEASRRWNEDRVLKELQIKKDSLALDTDEGARSLAPVIASRTQSFIDAQLYPVNGNNESLRQLAADIDSGKIKPTPEQLSGYARAAESQRSDMYQQLWREITAPAPGSNGDLKTSVLSTKFLGDSEKAKASILTAMTPFNDLVDHYVKGDLSVAKRSEANIKDIEAGAQLKIYDDKDFGKAVALTKGMAMIGGNNPAFIDYWDALRPPATMQKELKGLFTQTLQGITTQSTGDQRAPNPGDAVRLGTPVTLIDAIQKAKEGGFTGPGAAPMYKGWLDSIAMGVGNIKLPYPVRANLVAGTYGSENGDLMFNFKPDTVNDKGQRVPGSTSAFTTLVNPKITKAMFAMGGPTIQGDEPWNLYRDRAVKWFGDTFHQNLETLNSLKDSSYAKVQWDDEGHQFHIQFNHPGEAQRAARIGTIGQISQAAGSAAYSMEDYKIQTSVDNLNRGLKAIEDIAKKDPSVDVNSTIIRLLLSQGLDMGVLPKKMLQTLKSSVAVQ